MAGAHIAHATATFSELGLAIALVSFTDLPKWRAQFAAAKSQDAVRLETLKVAAKEAGPLYSAAVWLAANGHMAIKWWVVWYIAPLLAAAFGYCALMSMKNDGYLAIWYVGGVDISERATFVLAVLSFWIAVITAWIQAAASSVTKKAEDLKGG